MKTGKHLTEPLEALAKQFEEDSKLSPFMHVKKGTVGEVVNAGRQLLRYVKNLEKQIKILK